MENIAYREIEKAIIKSGFDWEVSLGENVYTFHINSPEGQDFNLEIDIENTESGKELIALLYERYYDFDVSEETYLWLDNTGHGKSGAPYDMKDVYNDMEWIKEAIYELCNAIEIKMN